jgi:hypothetical protein
MPKEAKRKIHVTTLEDCRRVLSSTINQLRRKEISITEAKTTAYLCTVLVQVFDAIRVKKVFDDQEND